MEHFSDVKFYSIEVNKLNSFTVVVKPKIIIGKADEFEIRGDVTIKSITLSKCKYKVVLHVSDILGSLSSFLLVKRHIFLKIWIFNEFEF